MEAFDLCSTGGRLVILDMDSSLFWRWYGFGDNSETSLINLVISHCVHDGRRLGHLYDRVGLLARGRSNRGLRTEVPRS